MRRIGSVRVEPRSVPHSQSSRRRGVAGDVGQDDLNGYIMAGGGPAGLVNHPEIRGSFLLDYLEPTAANSLFNHPVSPGDCPKPSFKNQSNRVRVPNKVSDVTGSLLILLFY